MSWSGRVLETQQANAFFCLDQTNSATITRSMDMCVCLSLLPVSEMYFKGLSVVAL